MKPVALIVAAVSIASASLVPSAASGIAGCAPAGPGGDWPFFGHDRSNTRAQPDEHVISPANVADLAPAWTFSSTQAQGSGVIDAVPVIADGCVYVGTNSGWVFSLNAETGALVWRVQVPGAIQSSLGVADGKVFVHQMATSDPFNGPRVAALDQATGALLWEQTVSDFPGAGIYASPMVFDGMVITGVSSNGAESGPRSGEFVGSLVFHDAATGELLHRTWTIPPAFWDDGFSGAGVWATAAVDEARKHVYVGTGNPFYNRFEYGTTNAIIKIDGDMASPTFGSVIGTYKGEQDQYITSERTVCDATEGHELGTIGGRDFVRLAACELFDLDFGASTNLWTSEGRLMVGGLQKSGTYHAVDAESMAPQWRHVFGSPAFALLTGAASTAVADGVVFGSYSPPSVEFALDGDTGARKWLAPLPGQQDTGRYEPTAVANGVVYQLDGNGLLYGLDASDGSLLLQRQISQDVESAVSTAAGGVSIARNTVFAAAGEFVVAYRTP